MRPPMLLLCLALTSFVPPLSLQGQALPGQALPGQALPGQALPGQALTRDIEAGTSLGGSLDWFRSDGTVEVGFTHRRTTLRRNAPGLDLGVTLFPRPLAQKVVFVAADAGLAQGTPLGTSLLLLKGGASAMLGVGDQFGVLVPVCISASLRSCR